MWAEGYSPLEGKLLHSVLTVLQLLSSHCINLLRGKKDVSLVYYNHCWIFLNFGGLNKSDLIHPSIHPPMSFIKKMMRSYSSTDKVSVLWIEAQEKTVVLIRVMMMVRPHLDACLLFCVALPVHQRIQNPLFQYNVLKCTLEPIHLCKLCFSPWWNSIYQLK